MLRLLKMWPQIIRIKQRSQIRFCLTLTKIIRIKASNCRIRESRSSLHPGQTTQSSRNTWKLSPTTIRPHWERLQPMNLLWNRVEKMRRLIFIEPQTSPIHTRMRSNWQLMSHNMRIKSLMNTISLMSTARRERREARLASMIWHCLRI